MLEIRGLRKTYGNLTVLSDLDLSVPTGALFGLMGDNGAGKTTLFRIRKNDLVPHYCGTPGAGCRHGEDR